MDDEAALLQTIIAHADEDTPRLVYADWLDEHDEHDRAVYIRTACRYHSARARELDYPELIAPLECAENRCHWWLQANRPALPPGFALLWKNDTSDHTRGFPHVVRADWPVQESAPSDETVEQVCQGLAQLVATTTLRSLRLPSVTADQLARVLASPGVGELRELTVGPSTWGGEFAQVVASAASLRNLDALVLNFMADTAGTRALARARFDRLSTLDLPGLTGQAGAVTELMGAQWFQMLQEVRAESVGPSAQGPLLRGLGRALALERLDFEVAHTTALREFAEPTAFRALARLFLWGTEARQIVPWLARARFPSLIELDVESLKNADFSVLVRAPWFPQLWVLTVSRGALTDRSAVALSKSSAAPNLRELILNYQAFGKTALAALADGTRFSNLTTLSLLSSNKTTLATKDTIAFAAALSLPRLRSLNLGGFPLGEAGAHALANNPALADLGILWLDSCRIGNRGLAALAQSPHLRNLIALGVSNNSINKPTALLDPDTFPNLRRVWLDGNRVPRALRAKLSAARNWSVEFSDE